MAHATSKWRDRKWMMQLDHERLDVYDLALEFLVLANGIIEGLPRGRSHSETLAPMEGRDNGAVSVTARPAGRGARGPGPRHKPRPTKYTSPTTPHGPSGTGTGTGTLTARPQFRDTP